MVFLGPIYIQQRLIDPEDITRTISLLLVYIIATIEISWVLSTLLTYGKLSSTVKGADDKPLSQGIQMSVLSPCS